MIVKVCTLEESERGTKAAGGAPWKQLRQFWNWFDGAQGASAGRPELAWCGSTETFVQQLEQGCSEPTEGEQDLMRMCLQEENYSSQYGLTGQEWRSLGAETDSIDVNFENLY